MFYKYKKYKQKYINFKNQIGGDCLVSPDDDDDYNVYFMEYMHKNSLIDHPQSKLDCFSTVTTAKFLFDGLKYDSETNVAYIDFNKTFLNINQIWYIIVNNNNYIRKLNDIENIDYLPRNLIQDKDKLAPVFYYTKEQKKYIEKWLMVFKNKLYIAAVNDMDKLFEAGSLQEVYSSDTELKSLIESADTTFKLSEHLYEHQVTNIKTLESERINENITSEKKLDNAFSLLILYTENLIL